MSLFQTRPTAILADLKELLNLLIQRLYFPHDQSGTHIDNLIVFADSSTKAYGAVVYLNSNDHVCLAMSKNRVAPIRSTTLPRLELMAVLLLPLDRLNLFAHQFLMTNSN